MRALVVGEIGPWPVSELGLRYRRYRLADEAGERDMVQSLRRHGQITPLVVCRREETLEVLDGFKRVAAALALGLANLRCQVLAADERQAKVALLTLHGAGKRLVELEEAWLVQALVREDGLLQVEVAELLGRHESWVSRRLALLEKLVEEVRQDLRLGLVSARTARALVSLPAGKQSRMLRSIHAEGPSSEEARGVVGWLQGACTREQEEYVLAQPRQALAEANQLVCPAWDPRLSVAGNRFSKQLARLLDQLARMESWLNQQSRAELRACDRLALQPGLERLVQGSRSVAELAEELLAELKA